MTKPAERHDLTADQYPLTLRLFSGTTNELLWSRTVTLHEALSLAKIEIPGYAGTVHYPVRTEITYGDGTTAIEGLA